MQWREASIVCLSFLVALSVLAQNTNSSSPPADELVELNISEQPLIKEATRSDWLSVYLSKDARYAKELRSRPTTLDYHYPFPVEEALRGGTWRPAIEGIWDFIIATTNKEQIVRFMQTPDRPLYLDFLEDYYRVYKHKLNAYEIPKEVQLKPLQAIAPIQSQAASRSVSEFVLHRAQTSHSNDVAKCWDSLQPIPEGQKVIKILILGQSKYDFPNRRFDLSFDNLSIVKGKTDDFVMGTGPLPGISIVNSANFVLILGSATNLSSLNQLAMAEDEAERFESETATILVYATGNLALDKATDDFLIKKRVISPAFTEKEGVNIIPLKVQQLDFVQIKKDLQFKLLFSRRIDPAFDMNLPQTAASVPSPAGAVSQTPPVVAVPSNATTTSDGRPESSTPRPPLVIPSRPADVVALMREAIAKAPSGNLQKGQTFEGFSCSRNGRSVSKLRLHIDDLQSDGGSIGQIVCTLDPTDQSSKARTLRGQVVDGKVMEILPEATSGEGTSRSGGILGGIIKFDANVSGKSVTASSSSLFDNSTYTLTLMLNESGLVGQVKEKDRVLLLQLINK